jgi:transmembrane sensor
MEFEKFSAREFASNGSFIRWVKGSDPEVNWFWESFLKDYPHKAKEIEEAKEIVSLLQFQDEGLTDNEVSLMRNQILMLVHAEKEMVKDDPRGSIKRNSEQRNNSWMRWAAVIALPLAVLVSIYLFSKGDDSNNLSVAFREHVHRTEKRINPRGQKSVLLLSDGTKVWLNAESQLDYSKDFEEGSTREVYLAGEAFFDVTPNPGRPFIVHTAGISIKVLGTAFNVKSYSNDKTIETTLVHGKVSINKMGDDETDGSLILRPNQRAIFTKGINTVDIVQVIAEKATSWRTDKLIFDETPFYDVLTQLERWYDVNIHAENREALTCGLTAEIENEKLEDVLQLLETTHGISYTISGKEIFIEGALCK